MGKCIPPGQSLNILSRKLTDRWQTSPIKEQFPKYFGSWNEMTPSYMKEVYQLLSFLWQEMRIQLSSWNFWIYLHVIPTWQHNKINVYIQTNISPYLSQFHFYSKDMFHSSSQDLFKQIFLSPISNMLFVKSWTINLETRPIWVIF